MFPPRTTTRSIVACTLACGLLATATSTAAARPIDDARAGAPTSSLAGTTTKQDLRMPDTRDAARGERQVLPSPDARDAANAEQIARMMEPYYSSYGKPSPLSQPVNAPGATAVDSASVRAPDDSPWLLISAIATSLAVVLACAAMVMRRRRAVTA
jgi:hypothetical protein